MAQLTGYPQIAHSDTSIVDSSQQIPLGTRLSDASGNEYVYLKGVGSTVAGNWVVYDEDYATTLLAANEVGPVAIAMAAIDATTEYGWYQIFGKNTIAITDTVAADKPLFIDGTAGRADDAGVAGDIIVGAYSMTADTSNVATVMLNYPHVSDELGGSAGAVGGSDTQVQFNDGGTVNGDAGMTYNKTTDTLTLAGPINMETANIEDSDASHYLVIKTTSNLTANRNLTIVPGDVARTITLAGDFNIAADLITSGANSLTLTTTGATNVTLPTTGTLATLAGSEALTNKTIGNTNTVTVKDANFTLQDDVDTAKQANFQLSGITTANTRTITLPDSNTTLPIFSQIITFSGPTAARTVTLPDEAFTVVGLATTQTLTNKTLTAPKIASGGFIADANGNELVIFTTTASAVNEITYANAATTTNPTITASGGDTNIGIDVVLKGTGSFNIKGNSTQAGELRLYEDTDDGTNYTSFKSPALAANVTYTLPTNDGDASQFLQTNGSGVLTWAAAGGGDWSKLDDDTLGAGATSVSNAIAARNHLKIYFYIDGMSASENAVLTFNSDTGNNYGWSQSIDLAAFGGTDATSGIRIAGNASSNPRWIVLEVKNLSATRKLIVGHSVIANATGTTAPSHVMQKAVWNNTAAQITTVTFTSGDAVATFNANSRLITYGASD